MKKVSFICSIAVLLVVNVVLVIINFSSIFGLKSKISSLKIDVNSYIADYDYKKLKSMISDYFYIKEDVDNDIRSYEYENELIEYSKNVTKKLFDNNYSSSDFMSKYFVRGPIDIFGFSYQSYEYPDYIARYEYLETLKKNITNNKCTYNGIDSLKMFYSFPDYYVVQLTLNGVSCPLFSSDNPIIEYRISKEESSNMLKVNSALYFDDNGSKQIDYNIFVYDSPYKNINGISNVEASDIFNMYYSSLVKIEVYDSNDKLVDEVSGFFVSKNMIVTVYDIFGNGIMKDYKYKIINSSGDDCTYLGMVTFSSYYNVAIIKTKENSKNWISLDYTNPLEIGQRVVVPGIDGNTHVGIFDHYDKESFVIKSILNLEKKDRGTPIINYYGKIIGINTRINDNSNVLLSVSTNAINNPYFNISSSMFNDIKVLNYKKEEIR